MTDAVVLIDIGSTYTKACAVDLEQAKILSTASSYTTAATDVNFGLQDAIKKLGDIRPSKVLACSSAAGGLRMTSIGLVEELTAQAAKLAALGAGAKLIGNYSYELSHAEAEKIQADAPEIILLAGGTDGGNKDVVLHNANMLAGIRYDGVVLYAGNSKVADDVRQILTSSGKQCVVTKNVMPRLNILDIEPCRESIREIFLQRIIAAKGITKTQELIDGILMPTPVAVLNAAALLSKGAGDEKGLGELMVADVGGATTDIYSICDGTPNQPLVMLRGLVHPYLKRTVEGDLGMRYNIGSAYSEGSEFIKKLSNCSDCDIQNYIDSVARDTDLLPQNQQQKDIDNAVAAYCTRTAVIRHSGTLEIVYTPTGATSVQTGKDLTEIKLIIATGGALINSDCGTVFGALADIDSQVLSPRKFGVAVDDRYIMSAMGVLAGYDSRAAFKILKDNIRII